MIYLDNNATTPLDHRVLDAMMPFLLNTFANPASMQHQPGQQAHAVLERARQEIAGLIGADTRELILTSGATESCNLALKGVASRYTAKGRHLIISSTEHKAVLDTAYALRAMGYEVTLLPVGKDGLINPDVLAKMIRRDTILVAVMWANNETGVIQPMAEIGAICAEKGTILFSDATQAMGKIPVRPRDAGVQLLAFSAHKFHGPKGIGALYISGKSPKLKLEPQQVGGGHEGGMRSGTVNVPGVVGMACALKLACDEMTANATGMRQLRDKVETALQQKLGAEINGSTVARLPNTANVRLPGIKAGELINALSSSVALAAGSACTAASPEPSHVLSAMGLTTAQVESSIRISLNRLITAEQISQAIDLIEDACQAIRG